MEARARVGVFDSGIGGLTVLGDAVRVCENTDFFYYGDNGNAPYGSKSAEEVMTLTESAVRNFALLGVDVVLLACNTATAICADSLRRQFSFPIVGIEPAVKPAAECCKEALVLATQRTAQSERLHSLLSQYPQCRFTVCGLPYAAGEIERYFTEKFENRYCDRNEEKPLDIPMLLRGCELPKSKYNVVILGCTHYLYFRREFSEYFGARVFDGGEGAAKQLAKVLRSKLTTNEHFVPPNGNFQTRLTSPTIFDPFLGEKNAFLPSFSQFSRDEDGTYNHPRPSLTQTNPNIRFQKKQNNRVFFLGKWSKFNDFIYNSNVCFKNK